MSGANKGSMFDPYIDEIKEMLDAGCSYGQIADELSGKIDRDFSESAIFHFVRTNGLRSLVTQGCRENRLDIPCCDRCEECTKVWNTELTNKHRLCKLLMAIVSPNCNSSPMQCPKREIRKEIPANG